MNARGDAALLLALVALLAACGPQDETAPLPDGDVTARTFRRDGQGEIQVREPIAGGTFYPREAEELRRAVRGLLDQADPVDVAGEVFGLIVPHASLPFSGPVAASAFRTVAGRRYDGVVVIGPSHFRTRPHVLVLDVDRVRTALGVIPVDRAATRALLAQGEWVARDARVFDLEHSIEVPLPFLQATVGDVPVVVIAVGDPDPALARRLATALDEIFRGRRALFVASSDLSHYRPYDVARRVDRETLALIERGDLAGLAERTASGELEACGVGPILTLVDLFQRRGGGEIRVVDYRNSGDTAGGRERVVGYGAVVLVGRQEEAGTMSVNYLSDEEKGELLRIARGTVEDFVRTGKRPEFQVSSETLRRDGAAFVTLRKKGRLRGCIGHVQAREPLYLSVRDMAVAAASEDPRFPPVSREELEELEIEVSVLTPMQKVTDPKTIQVGRDGLLIRKGFRQGLLLPQVPDEYGWDRETFLEQTCRKAGLPASAWKDPATEILSFQAIVFQEG